jgi:hypothetical protein
MQQKIIKQKVFWFSLLSSCLLFLSIAEGQKIFAELWLIHELIQLLVFLFFIGTIIWSIVFLWKQRSTVKLAYLPLLIQFIMVAVIVILPINWLRNKMEFDAYRDEFDKAAQIIMDEKLEELGHPQIVELPAEYKHLSLDGVVFVIHKQNTKGIFFFTFRGAPEGMSGYLKVQEHANLQEYINAISTEEHLIAKDLENNWYYITVE